MKDVNWIKKPGLALWPCTPPRGCTTSPSWDNHASKLIRNNASILVVVEKLEVNAGLRVPTDATPVELGPAWESHPRPTRKRIKGDLPILGYVQWSAAYPRDRHDPKRGCMPGSEDQVPETCDACNGEHREGFVCLRCLPGGPARAIKRQASLKSMQTTDERKTSKVRTGKRFAARELVLAGSRDERE